jgi:hypothetical protein
MVVPIVHLTEICNTLSIPETTGQNFHIYPSPADEYIRIVSTVGVQHAEIISLHGQVVRTASDQPGQFSLYTGDLVAGTYFLRIFTGTEVVVRKITITH